jgi:hypothetical protein
MSEDTTRGKIDEDGSYAYAVGKLIYAMLYTRPNICFVISMII